jgi:hypothetical protein
MINHKHTPANSGRPNQIVAEARRIREERKKGYRERALKLFAPVCALCGREFEGKRLRELTVHHKDHDHNNNPPDGSNWELLCIYCHDNVHSRHQDAEILDQGAPEAEQGAQMTHRPFADLEALLKGRK